jgi:hypothetical protein
MNISIGFDEFRAESVWIRCRSWAIRCADDHGFGAAQPDARLGFRERPNMDRRRPCGSEAKFVGVGVDRACRVLCLEHVVGLRAVFWEGFWLYARR